MSKASIMIAMVTVVALQDQRCRAGRIFSREAQDIPVGELTEDELAALRADPFLYVTESEVAVAAAEPEVKAEPKADAKAAEKDDDKAKDTAKK